jgi:4-diphosphocytidyl-2-C-methyl-D-erythritol kinase
MEFTESAPAKVNLFLHVGPLGDDGYHPICSLVAFADVGDVVRVRPAGQMSFAPTGPFAEDLGEEGGNLVVRARDLGMAAFPNDYRPFRLTLEKNLPIASGVGGGSADAAATLRLLWTALDWAHQRDAEERWAGLSGKLGADVAMCLASAPAVARGRGDELEPPPAFTDLEAVLVNPMRPSPTGRVYAAYDAAGAPGDADPPPWPEPLWTAQAVAEFLAGCRNDLEPPAISLQPAIAEVLATLRSRPETLFARMSGSGATCFALCATRRDRDELALALGSLRRDWWVKGCRLAGFHP